MRRGTGKVKKRPRPPGDAPLAIRKTAQDPESKLYRSISEVSDVLRVKAHVLRYWETQFSMLRPKNNRAGNRMYRPEEVRLLMRIKELLYDRRYTIAGARCSTSASRTSPRSSWASTRPSASCSWPS